MIDQQKAKELTSDVNDLLNQIMLKLEAVKPAERDNDYEWAYRIAVPRITEDNYEAYKGQKGLDGYSLSEGDIMPEAFDESRLSAIKSIVTLLVAHEMNAINVFEQYYNSTC